MNTRELYELLAKQGVRLFALSLGKDHVTLIHHSRSVEEWRVDIRRYIAEIKHLRSKFGRADSEIFNQLMIRLHGDGYLEVNDVVSDAYEGRVAVYSAGIEDDPDHEEQPDGFGHYGWESKKAT